MEKDDLDKSKFDRIPLMVEPTVRMREANEPIEIYNGKYILKYGNTELEIIGNFKFEWFPHCGVYFYGEFISNSIIDHFNIDSYTIKVNNTEVGKGYLVSSSLGGLNKKTRIKGILTNQTSWGDTSIPVDEIRFSIPNLREFFGKPSKKITGNKVTAYRNRLELGRETLSFTIDKLDDFKDLKDSVNSNGGFIVNYSGQITSNKGLSFNEINKVFDCFNRFLWFLNGRRTSALFIEGVYQNETKWKDLTPYHVDTHKYVNTWPPSFSIKELDTLWFNFDKLWKNSDGQDFLKTLLHWYVESNGNSGMAEGAIIMGQTALELVYNWWIIEDKRMISGKESESISASNKIRLILSQLDIEYEVPKSLKKLREYSKGLKFDGPDSIVEIRNAIVHSHSEKRKKLSSIDSGVIYEASQLLLLYLELSLLRILDYKGSFSNRCNSGNEEIVPWVDTTH